jgi:hypothetical protein
MKEHQPNAEELAAGRHRAQAALSAAAERIFGGSGQLTKSAPAQIQFDWDALITDGCMAFHLSVSRRDQCSLIDFSINLNKLAPTARERLDNFIARRQAGLRDDYDLALHLSWLLETWLIQAAPALSRAERQRRVRELLLVREQ